MPYTFNRLLKEGYWFLYYAFAYHLPGHKVPFWGKFSSHLRSYLLRKVFPDSHHFINVGRHAYFGHNRVKVGQRSGFGDYFHLQNASLTMGDYVMTGAHVTILGGGHRYEKKDVPIAHPTRQLAQNTPHHRQRRMDWQSCHHPCACQPHRQRGCHRCRCRSHERRSRLCRYGR